MAQPLDIRVVFQPGTGSVMVLDGREINTTSLGNDAVIWYAVLLLTSRLPSENVHTEELHRTHGLMDRGVLCCL
jgi:hypothetical protein